MVSPGGEAVEAPVSEEAGPCVARAQQAVGDDGDLQDNQDHDTCNVVRRVQIKVMFIAYSKR